MFWQEPDKAAFISDPVLLNHIERACRHVNPFVLIGPQHTGKNVFLKLVAKGSTDSQSVPCIDENVSGDHDSDLERFFGKGGYVGPQSRCSDPFRLHGTRHRMGPFR